MDSSQHYKMEQPSEKQIKYAQFLGIETPWEYSKQDLRAKIEEKVEGQKKTDEEMSNPVTYRPGEPKKVAQKAPMKEFHLSPEQVNTNALDLAVRWLEKHEEPLKLMDLAKQFKEFIENGR